MSLTHDHIKKEYVLVKKGSEYFYARLNLADTDLYLVLTSVTENEGRDIIRRANGQSEFTQESERLYNLVNHKSNRRKNKDGHKTDK